MSKKADTKQTDAKGRFVKGNTVAKDKGVDFGSKPENRHNGRWKPENSISYNYNKFLAMSEEEFAEFKPQTKAQRIAYNRIKDAEDSLNDTKEITDRIEGKAPQSIDMTSKGESINPYAALTTEELRKLAGK